MPANASARRRIQGPSNSSKGAEQTSDDDNSMDPDFLFDEGVVGALILSADSAPDGAALPDEAALAEIETTL